jgi:hypothetical protein
VVGVWHQALLFTWLCKVASFPVDPDDEGPVEGAVPLNTWQDVEHSVAGCSHTHGPGAGMNGGDSEADCEAGDEAGCEGVEDNGQADDVAQEASASEGWGLVDLPDPTAEVDWELVERPNPGGEVD